MATQIAKATSAQVREVLQLLISGTTSDASSMEEIAGSWWRRLMFMHWFGPRFLGNQMDTFIAAREEGIIGFVIVQYDGDAAGTFDWAFVEPLEEEENREDFAELIDTALDFVEEQGIHPYFYFGFATASPPQVGRILEEIGLRSADYQLAQMVGALPLAQTADLPQGFRLAPQISSRFGQRLAELLPSVYPDADADEIEMIASIHSGTLRSSKIFLVLEDEKEVGFVQQFRWRSELRLLYALPPRLWGSSAERQLVAYAAGATQGQNTSLRLRTFSGGHLEAARRSLSELGLSWERAPWQRWVVGLEAERGEDAGAASDDVGHHSPVWPPQGPQGSDAPEESAAQEPGEAKGQQADGSTQ